MTDDKSKTTDNLRHLAGRPMLHWISKAPLHIVKAYPGQLIELFSPVGAEESENLLLHGDNKDCLSYLATNGYRGTVDFVYIDPPFNTGSDNYVRKVKLRGSRLKKVDGESMSILEQTQYANAFFPDLFLQSIFERLQLLGELMTTDATIAVRIDYRFAHYIKILLDEVFGPTNFINEILVGRQRESAGSPKKLDVVTESIFVYSSSPNRIFNKQRVNRSIANTAWTDFLMGDERFPRERIFFGKTMTPPAGQHYPLKQEKVDKLIKERYIRLRCTACGYIYYFGESAEDLERFMRKKENRFKFYDLYSNKEYAAVETVNECIGCAKDSFHVDYLGSDEESVSTNWTDISSYANKTGYPTENSEVLLERLIKTYSNRGNLVIDCFMGSGTTAAVAQKLGRRWIGCDINKGSIQTTSKRLQNIIKEQVKSDKQAKLPTGDEQDIKPVLAFKHYRVNDYDLQIQHNEALELALEFVGVVRKRSDSFFEGELGKNLVKVVPFTHPCTMLDIELIKTELKNRPDEDRNITVISLGKDASVIYLFTHFFDGVASKN